MKKKELFFGAATALVTPFKDGEVDYDSFCRLIDYQIASGIDAIVIGGTTGEAATLTDRERYSLFSLAKERAQGKVKVIFGTGTNDTSIAVTHTKNAEEIGCDGVLVVTPYYNKGTYTGLIKHYQIIANSTDLPIILYNVPSRTGTNLELSALETLAKEENIVGIKEASDSAERLVSLAAFGEELHLYAGNDSTVYTTLSLGGKGVISVASNLLPTLISKICHSYREERRDESLRLQLKMLPFIKSLFKETNPAPIKYLMSRSWKGVGSPIISEELRLPLAGVCEETRSLLDERFKSLVGSVVI